MPSLLLAIRPGTAAVERAAPNRLAIVRQPAEYGVPQVQMRPITVGDQGADTGGLPKCSANVAKRGPPAIARPRDALRDVDDDIRACHARAVTRRFQRGPRVWPAPKAPHGSGRGHVPFYVDDEPGRQPAPVTGNNGAAYPAESELALDIR